MIVYTVEPQLSRAKVFKLHPDIEGICGKNYKINSNNVVIMEIIIKYTRP